MPSRERPDSDSADRARSSRRRYEGFVGDYRAGHLDASTDARDEFRKSKEPAEVTEETEVTEKAGLTEPKAKGLLRGKRRQYLREYLRWLWPHRVARAS